MQMRNKYEIGFITQIKEIKYYFELSDKISYY